MNTRKALTDVGKVLLAIVVGLALCWLIGGCSPRIVEVEKPVVVEQSHYSAHTDIVRDTLIWRDSVYHYVQGDTCIIERWHHTERVERVGISDTLRDTIPRIVTVTETQVREVNVLKWWQKVLMAAGIVGIVTLTVVLGARRISKS